MLLEEPRWQDCWLASVCLETRWLGQKAWFSSPGMLLYTWRGRETKSEVKGRNTEMIFSWTSNHHRMPSIEPHTLEHFGLEGELGAKWFQAHTQNAISRIYQRCAWIRGLDVLLHGHGIHVFDSLNVHHVWRAEKDKKWSKAAMSTPPAV